MAKDKGPYRAKPKLKDRFYKTLIVYDAVKSVGPKTLRPMVMYQAPDHPLDKEEEVFRRFVDKIAQFCDCRKGGSTVTSIAVLGASIPLYVLASNKRNQKEDRAVTSFVSDMLRQVRELGERGSGNGSWTAQHDHLLEYVIAFNSQRVADLIKMVGEAAGLSLNALANDDSPGVAQLAKFLEELRDESSNVRLSRLAARSPSSGSSPGGNQAATPPAVQPTFRVLARIFISRISCLFETSATNETPQSESQSLLILLSARCRNDDQESCWYGLRHNLGRLHSYRSGIHTLLRAYNRWPQLFDGPPRVYVIPAHPVDERPIRNGQPQTAQRILTCMLPSVTSSDEAKRQFDHYSACLRDIDVRAIQPGQSGKDLNTAISERWKTLKPMAHAEITLIDWLKRTNPDDDDDDDLLDEECPARDISNCETEDDSHSDDGLTVVTTSTRRTKSSVALTAAGNNGLRASRFFKGWAYIGSSKGPCRLCSYFLETLPEPSRVSMRQGHGGIYASWRLPDVPPEDAYNVPLATAQEDGTAAMVTKQDLRTLVREQMATAQRLREADLRARDNVLQEILKRLRRDVLHEIEAGCASRRRFDSTTLTRTVATNFGASAVFNPAAATLGESVVEPVFEDTVSESGRHRKAGVVPRMDDDDDGPSEHMKAVSLRRTEPPAVGESAFSEIGGVRDEGLDEWHGFDDD